MTTDQKALTLGSYLGAAISLVSGVTLTEWGVIFGIVVGAATYFTNLHFKRQHLKIEQQRLEAELESLKNK